jgi:Holliday junction resolvase RusA-like endonuclease
MTTPHPYRGWVDENDVGNACCLAPRDDPIHLRPPVAIKINVRGLPIPQGSMKAVPAKYGNHVALKYPPGVYQWRGQVQYAVCEAMAKSNLEGPIDGAVKVELGFDLPRLQSHFWPVNRNHHGEVRDDAPIYPLVAPDLDKLIRAICDSITDAGLWKDDSQVVYLQAAKRYADPAGVLITITPL